MLNVYECHNLILMLKLNLVTNALTFQSYDLLNNTITTRPVLISTIWELTEPIGLSNTSINDQQ